MKPEVLIERLRDCGIFSAEGGESLMLEAADMIESLQAELLEEARLSGMGGEREAKLLAQIERMEKEIKPWVERYHTVYKELVATRLDLEELRRDPRKTEPTQT